jgi:hypothetical protein
LPLPGNPVSTVTGMRDWALLAAIRRLLCINGVAGPIFLRFAGGVDT